MTAANTVRGMRYDTLMGFVTPQTIIDAASALRSGSVSAQDLVDASLEAIARDNARTNAFILVDTDGARAAARNVDAERRRGIDRGPLHGIPISLKDLVDVAGQPTTAASRVLHDRIPTEDAPLVTRLRDAGAVLLGKTNLHEFALGTTSEFSAFGPVRHPQDPERSAGGSSGGSAAAVATGMGLASVGTDTGGSIRIPAAACGVVGLKPSLGDVPTDGVVPLSFTLDHVGPLTRTVPDAACVWAALAGRVFPRLNLLAPAALRLRLLGGYFASPLAREVRVAVDAALEQLRRSGATISETVLANTASIAETYGNVVLPEGAYWHAPYLAARAADYTPVIRERFEAGLAITAVDYLKARQARLAWRDAVDAALEDADALVLPTLPIVAPRLGATEVTVDAEGGETLPVRSAMLRLTQLFNITGHPALSLPLATTGLPIGLQLVGRRGETLELLAIGEACETIIGAPGAQERV
jgi:Asp-tRNA(Asn)/Glu-tRNA(Gln) amidotransferase A subunit family amidase